jgi:hypothetical protein
MGGEHHDMSGKQTAPGRAAAPGPESPGAARPTPRCDLALQGLHLEELLQAEPAQLAADT